MPKFENRFTTGNLIQIVGLTITIATIGISIGIMKAEIEGLKEAARQSASDSRALIELRTDVAYIKQAVQNLSRDLRTASSPIPCPSDQPVLVASYCRSASSAFIEQESHSGWD